MMMGKNLYTAHTWCCVDSSHHFCFALSLVLVLLDLSLLIDSEIRYEHI